ncbi:MAG: Mrp/NBP35 family ATP-binding protein [Clostridia bacterium]|nr:Mrp/NBP35 family ATP-binding protein [Clostridia bacterium]
MSECTHNCSTCKDGSCKDRKKLTVDFNKDSKVDKIIAVVSGKGGVGKSLVCSMLAINANNKGLKTAVLDADITGPSIPKIFGVTPNQRAIGSEQGLIPVTTKSGVDVMSINLLLEEETKPVVWRGPVISAVVQQFYTDVLWKEKDIMFIDMPPGTGDVPLTVFQSFKIDGIIVVTTPQDLNNMIVEKSIAMANMLNIPVLGIVENMAYYECEECGKKEYIFGKGKVLDVANKYGVPVLASLPIKPSTARLVDEGNIDKVDVSNLDDALKVIMENK